MPLYFHVPVKHSLLYVASMDDTVPRPMRQRPSRCCMGESRHGQKAENHDENVYLSVTLSPSSRFFENPESLAVNPALTHLGSVGALRDVQLLSAPRGSWPRLQGEILASLNSLEGVKHVEIQGPPRQRVKRGDDL